MSNEIISICKYASFVEWIVSQWLLQYKDCQEYICVFFVYQQIWQHKKCIVLFVPHPDNLWTENIQS